MILLDTHIAVWLASDNAQLRSSELAIILEPDNEIVVSTVSIWEMRIKWSKHFRSGERKGPIHPRDMLVALREINLVILPLTAEHSSAELRVALEHSDPFDITLAHTSSAKNRSTEAAHPGSLGSGISSP